MYKIKKEKLEILKDGRKLKEISDIIGITKQYLSNILNGNLNCKKPVAMSLISIKENIPINDSKMQSFLKYYFTEE